MRRELRAKQLISGTESFAKFLFKALSKCLSTFSVGHPTGACGFKNNRFVSNFSFKIKQSRWIDQLYFMRLLKRLNKITYIKHLVLSLVHSKHLILALLFSPFLLPFIFCFSLMFSYYFALPLVLISIELHSLALLVCLSQWTAPGRHLTI